jgi:hypothetical protein
MSWFPIKTPKSKSLWRYPDHSRHHSTPAIPNQAFSIRQYAPVHSHSDALNVVTVTPWIDHSDQLYKIIIFESAVFKMVELSARIARKENNMFSSS